MSKFVIGQSPEVREIARILGVDLKGVTGFDVRFRVDELVTVTVHKALELDGEILSLTPRKFNLVPVSEPKP